MKIFLVSNLYPSIYFPNFGTFVGEFARGITTCGAEIPFKAVIDRKTNSIPLKLWIYIRLYCRILFYGIFGEYDILYVHYIAHTSLPVYLVSLLRRNKIIVLNAHGDDILPRTRLVEQLQKIVRKLLHRTALVVVPSEYFKKVFLSKFIYPERNIYVSPSGGVDLNLFHEISHARQEIGYSEKDIIIGFVSRISKGKGWGIFIDCFVELKEKYPLLKAIIIGNGDETDSLMSRINCISDIRFIEGVNHNELPLYYSAFDLFIFPSELNESLGLVGIEAMACGTPVIGSDIGGIPTFLRNGQNGYLFKTGNREDLCNKIEKYIHLDNSSRTAMTSAAIKTAHRYETARIMKELHTRMLLLHP